MKNKIVYSLSFYKTGIELKIDQILSIWKKTNDTKVTHIRNYFKSDIGIDFRFPLFLHQSELEINQKGILNRSN